MSVRSERCDLPSRGRGCSCRDCPVPTDFPAFLILGMHDLLVLSRVCGVIIIIIIIIII